MELVKEKTFLVTCDEYNTILKQCDLVNGHFSALGHAIKGAIDSTVGDIGQLKAIESIIYNTHDSFDEVEEVIKKLRHD